MKRFFSLITMLMLTSAVFGQLSYQQLQQNAERNIRNSDYLSFETPGGSPMSLEALNQHIEPNVTLLGFQFGVNMSKLVSDSAHTESSYKTGFRGGFLLGVYYSRDFTLETGLIYEGKGFVKNNTEKIEHEVDTAYVTFLNKYDYSARFNYLQIPLYGRLTFGDHVQFYTTFGLYLGIPLMATYDGTWRTKTIIRMKNGSQMQEFETLPDTLTGDADALEGLDLGGAIGFGFTWPLKLKGFTGPAPSLFVDVKYQRSLLSIGKRTEEEIEVPGGDPIIMKYPAPEAFNSGFAVTAGFTFPLSVK